MDELAYLNTELKLILRDKRPGGVEEKVFEHKGGLVSYVELLTNTKQPLLMSTEDGKGKRKKAGEREGWELDEG